MFLVQSRSFKKLIRVLYQKNRENFKLLFDRDMVTLPITFVLCQIGHIKMYQRKKRCALSWSVNLAKSSSCLYF